MSIYSDRPQKFCSRRRRLRTPPSISPISDIRQETSSSFSGPAFAAVKYCGCRWRQLSVISSSVCMSLRGVWCWSLSCLCGRDRSCWGDLSVFRSPFGSPGLALINSGWINMRNKAKSDSCIFCLHCFHSRSLSLSFANPVDPR